MIKMFADFKLDEKISKRICMFFAFVALIMLNQEAFGTDGSGNTTTGTNDAITQVLCNVVNQLQSGIGKGIATIGIIVLGIGLFLGKLSWPLALATALGIALIFGATSIVAWISAGTAGSAGATTNVCAAATPS